VKGDHIKGIIVQTSIIRAIIVCSLGYFIDIFDIQLFAVLRVSSLTELGVPPDRLPEVGGYILNAQMAGMIAGAFLWGWLGDKFGRLKALYGSILIYSLGTLACAVIHDPLTYGVCRFVTGFGLAGETGAAVTLVAELMSPKNRAWGVTIVGGIGAFGPVFATLLAWFWDWRTTYVIAGVMGLGLLVLRLRLVEPALFQKIHVSDNIRGSLKLFLNPRMTLMLLCCMAIGLQIPYSVNLLNFYSLEISKSVLGAGEIFDQKLCMLLFYVGIGLGNVSCGAISQLWQSRRKTLFSFLLCGAITTGVYLFVCPVVKITAHEMYGLNFILGFTLSSLILVMLMTAEHFGTNIRATATALVANAQRASVIPMIFALQGLNGTISFASSAAVIGAILYIAAFLALGRLRETHGRNLDYRERRGIRFKSRASAFRDGG
jgi:MFS family permease